MINSGLPLVQSLSILAAQTENKALKDVTKQVVFDVEAGNTLADAFSRHPKAFSDLYVNMVAAGEAGGILDTILLRLATFLEKNDALVRKVKSAMIYPAVIMSVAAIAIAVLLIFVIPMFQSMFASVQHGAAAPDPHRDRHVRVPHRLLVGHPGGHRRRGVPHPAVLRHAGRAPEHRPDDAQRPGPGRRDPEVRGVALHPDARHPHQLRRVDPRRPRDHRQDRRQPGHPRRGDGVAATRSPAAKRSPPRSSAPRCFRPWSSR